VPAIAKRLEEARSSGTPVVYVCDAHEPDDVEFRLWPPHAVGDTPGAEVVEELAPGEGELVVTKTTLSAFYNTGLEEALGRLRAEHLIITGVVTNICVLFAVLEAQVRGYRVTVPPDCVAGLNEEDHAFALRQIQDVLNPARG
jgi:nicotinamidase-related amidase